MTRAPWTIYARQLFSLSYGHPLWGPEPCLTFGEVHLGDVGYLQDGHFSLLFNATRSADDPINSLRGVPEGFQVLNIADYMIKRLPNEITQPLLHSKSLQATSVSAGLSLSEPGAATSANLSYDCEAEEGALLMLKKPAHRTYLNCNLRIRKYMREHISSWCAFANEKLEIGLKEEDIIFVSGHTKTPVWAEAAFGHSTTSGELIIAGGIPSASGEFRVFMSRAIDASVFSRTGPLDRALMWAKDPEQELPVDSAYDQCIFLNYYKTKSRAWWRSAIRAAAGDHVLPDNGDSDGMLGTVASSSSDNKFDTQDEVEKAYDPVGSLLDYILKYSDAKAACACDADLRALFKDKALPQDLDDALKALSPTIVSDEDGTGIIASSASLEWASIITLPSLYTSQQPRAISGSSSTHEVLSLPLLTCDDTVPSPKRVASVHGLDSNPSVAADSPQASPGWHAGREKKLPYPVGWGQAGKALIPAASRGSQPIVRTPSSPKATLATPYKQKNAVHRGQPHPDSGRAPDTAGPIPYGALHPDKQPASPVSSPKRLHPKSSPWGARLGSSFAPPPPTGPPPPYSEEGPSQPWALFQMEPDAERIYPEAGDAIAEQQPQQ